MILQSSHNRAALLLLLSGGGGDGGPGEAGDHDGTGAADCSKGCAANPVEGVVLLSLKENKNLYQIKFQRNYF